MKKLEKNATIVIGKKLMKNLILTIIKGDTSSDARTR